MSTRFQLGSFAIALTLGLTLSSGCGQPMDADPTASLEQHGALWVPPPPNGTGVHAAEDILNNEENSYGPVVGGYQWNPIGFYSPARATGGAAVQPRMYAYYSSGATPITANGLVDYALYAGAMYNSVQIVAKESNLSFVLEYLDTNGVVIRSATVVDEQVTGVQLRVKVPYYGNPTSLDRYYSYFLGVGARSLLKPDGTTVYGYALNVAPQGGAWSPYCLAKGTAEQAVFYQGSLFHPSTAMRADHSSYVTLTCKSGGVATCMSWDEVPWISTAKDAKSNPLANLKEYHQACIQMKRAAYFGDGVPYTINGTLIYRRDNLMDPQMNDPLASIVNKTEALWDAKGAVCVNDKYRRHPELLLGNINTNANSKPSCGEYPWAGFTWLVASALP